MGSGAIFSVGAFVRTSAHLSELPAAQAAWRRQVALFSSKGLTGENTTSLEDCLMLYLLIRHYNCRNVFEIGTNVGATAAVMNEAVKGKSAGCARLAIRSTMARLRRTAGYVSSARRRMSRSLGLAGDLSRSTLRFSIGSPTGGRCGWQATYSKSRDPRRARLRVKPEGPGDRRYSQPSLPPVRPVVHARASRRPRRRRRGPREHLHGVLCTEPAARGPTGRHV